MTYPDPIIENHEGFFVVRDDLLEYGSKIRFFDEVIENLPHPEIVYGSSPRWGYAQISLAYLAKKYNKKFTLFIAKSKDYHPYTQRAIDLGANVIQIDPGYLAVTEKRAKDYCYDANGIMNDEERYLFFLGGNHPSVITNIRLTAMRMNIAPDHVWVASSSGTLQRGLALAWPNAEVHAVCVGRDLEKDKRTIGNALVHRTKYTFNQPCKDSEKPPYPSAPEYDAKVWTLMKDYYKTHEKPKYVLVWNVGA